jgi:hypothetical protein
MNGRAIGIVLLACALSAPAQMKMSIAQLKSFVKSSIQLQHDDRKVAQYLKQITLTQKLDEDVYTDLISAGVGDKTAEVLRNMMNTSRDLPRAGPEAPKPAARTIPPPSAAEQAELIKEITEYAINYSKRLPDFICTQVTRRFFDPTGLEFWQRQDVVVAKLSYFEQKEDYRVMLVNDQPADTTFDKLDGSTSQGEFGSMMKEIFEPETQARFEWLRWATLGGRRAHVISYQVRQDRSKWSISYQRAISITPAYGGLIYVDRDSRTILRITLQAQGIPPSFPIQEASTTLDFDFVDISGNKFMLPLKSTMRMRESRFLAKNEVEFRMYRKFGADAVITFDTSEALPDREEKKEEPPR